MTGRSRPWSVGQNGRVDDVPAALREMFAGARTAADFVGLTERAARERASSEGISRVRAFRMDAQMSGRADHRPDRLNIVVRDGLVILASYF